MTTEIDFTAYTAPVTTTEGEPVEIIFRNGRGDYPIGGYVGNSDYLRTWTRFGRHDINQHLKYDLIPAEPVVIEYQNQYVGGSGSWFESRALADNNQSENRIGIIWRKRKGNVIINAGVVGGREP